MPRPILVFTGDNHLKPTTWTKHPTLRGDAYHSWRQIFQYCLNNSLPLALLGDQFDRARPDPLSVMHYLDCVRDMQRQSLPVYYIEGNHDRASPPWASLSAWAQCSQQLCIGDIPICGISFTNKDELAAQLAAIPPGTQVLLAHQSWLEIQRVGHTDGAFGMIPFGLTMLTGDYHVCGVYRGTAANGEPVVAYSPGSTAMQALNEPATKYFGILHDDLSVTWQPLVTRQLVSVTCQTVEELEETVQRLSTDSQVSPSPLHVDIAKPILRVRYNDALPEAYDRLTAVVGDRFHLFLEPQHQSLTQVIDQNAMPETAFDSLLSAVAELCASDASLYNMANRLLRSNSLKTELEQAFAEFKESYAATRRTTRVPPD